MTDSRSKSILKGTGIYAIGTFGTKFLSFLIVPLYTYYLATEDYGVYDIIMSTINLLTPLVTMQISDAVYRLIISKDVEDKDRYIRAGLQVIGFNCIVASVIILLCGLVFDIPYLFYLVIVLCLSRIYQSMIKILRGLKNQWLFAISGIIYTIVFLSLNIIQLCVLRMGVECLFRSTIASCLVTVSVILIFEPGLRVSVFKKPEMKLIGEMYRYSIPLVPNYLNWWIINSSDRYIVLWAIGTAANGLLAIAHKFPTMLQAVLQLFINSWTDVSIADKQEDRGRYYTKVFRMFYVLSFTSLLCIIPATKVLIGLVMNSSYKQACDYVAFYYLGTVFQAFSSFYGVGYLKGKKTGGAFSTSIYGAVVNAAVNVMFIWIIGLQAAAVSTFLGFLVMWLVRERQNRNELNIEINWNEIIIFTLMSVTMSLASIFTGTFVNVLLTLAGGLVFLALNMKTIKGFIKKRK